MYTKFVCGKCGGLMLGDMPKAIIAGQTYHVHCGHRLIQEKLEKDIQKLSKK